MGVNKDAIVTFVWAILGVAVVSAGFMCCVQFLIAEPNEGMLLWDLLYIGVAIVASGLSTILFYTALFAVLHVFRLIERVFDMVFD